MINVRFTSFLVLCILSILVIAVNNDLRGTPEGTDTAGNRIMNSANTSESILYSNPELGFSLEFPSDWYKEESLSFISPPGGINNQSPEVISISTEVLPTFDFSLEEYTEAAMDQVELFQDFELLNSSSVTLAGLPGHMIAYSFTDENQTPLQNLQVWTIKDGKAYVITYGGTPEEFDSSLSVLRKMMNSFRIV